MENEFMKRGYLLPNGCKDLSGAAKAKQKPTALFMPSPKSSWVYNPETKSWTQLPAPLPPLTRQVFIPPRTTVNKLAALLDLKPFEIVGDLMQLGMHAEVEDVLAFNTICAVARMHGFLAIKAG
jgi:hypothetical protein